MTLDQYKKAKELQEELENIQVKISAMEQLHPEGLEKALVRSDRFSFEIPARLLFAQVQTQLGSLKKQQLQLQNEFNNL